MNVWFNVAPTDGIFSADKEILSAKPKYVDCINYCIELA